MTTDVVLQEDAQRRVPRRLSRGSDVSRPIVGWDSVSDPALGIAPFRLEVQ
jgi:hypothetical protein